MFSIAEIYGFVFEIRIWFMTSHFCDDDLKNDGTSPFLQCRNGCYLHIEIVFENLLKYHFEFRFQANDIN